MWGLMGQLSMYQGPGALAHIQSYLQPPPTPPPQPLPEICCLPLGVGPGAGTGMGAGGGGCWAYAPQGIGFLWKPASTPGFLHVQGSTTFNSHQENTMSSWKRDCEGEDKASL